MNNLLCVFFGHVKGSFFTDDGELWIECSGVKVANFQMCKRCEKVFIETFPKKGNKTLKN